MLAEERWTDDTCLHSLRGFISFLSALCSRLFSVIDLRMHPSSVFDLLLASPPLEMEREFLNRQLLDHIQTLEQQGIIDNYFRICHSLKEHSGIYFFVELVPMFCSDVRTVVRGMITALNQSAVDFNELYEHCIKLQGSSGCFGACQIRNACSDLRQAIDNRSKDWCMQAVNVINQEYHNLRSKLDTLVQLERRIISGESYNNVDEKLVSQRVKEQGFGKNATNFLEKSPRGPLSESHSQEPCAGVFDANSA